MYVLLGKIAYHIHFHKAYPIKRKDIDEIVNKYNQEYGYSLETEDIIKIVKTSKILSATEESSETFRFRNKSILAYFVAREIISQYNDTGDATALNDVINKACVNICTDILLFIIYLTDQTIVICDDCESDALAAKEVIKRTAQELHIKTDFDIYSNAPEVKQKLPVKKEPAYISHT